MAKFTIGAALEDAGLDLGAGDGGQAADQLELEQGSDVTESQAGDIDELATAVEDAVADIGTLEEIAEPLQESVEPTNDAGEPTGETGEGVTEQTAEVAEIAVEAIRARLGLKTSRSCFPGMEAFGGKSSRVMATKVALEGIGDTIKSAWEAIKRIFKQIKDKVMNFFKSIFDENMRLQKSAKSTVERLRSFKGTEKKEDAKIKSSGLIAALTIDGKADPAKVIANSVGAMEMFQVLNSQFEEMATKLEGAMKKKAEERAEAVKGIDVKNVVKGVELPTLSGDISMKIEYGEDDLGTYVVLKEDAGKTKNEETELEVLEVSALSGMAAKVLDLTKEIDKVKSSKAGDKFFNVYDKSLDACLKAAISGMSDEGKASASEADKAARKIFSSIGTVYAKLSTKSAGLAVKGGKAVLGYVTASMGQYKAGKAE